MGDVVRLVQFQNRETLAILRALTIAAANGDVLGIKAEIRMRGGRVATCATGPFVQPAQAADGTDNSLRD